MTGSRILLCNQRLPEEKEFASCPLVGEFFGPKAMAELEDKNPENVEGKFYVDDQCIDCDLCRETAPLNFQRSDDEGYSFVYKQPESEEEVEQCLEAMEGCPVEAIGDDGK
ncbi:ferredoxin [Akkermansiaceae bacterium]|nr:ferredoxin [Akkermansiaceae bacterium]MDB4568310.1 ferredoxin [Akkermansiaceae bacterium]MDB4659342.1 ferredoxin [Akkermansiaceae bacterium]